MPVDRLHHADPGELHRAVVLRGLGDAIRGGSYLFHAVLGLGDFLGQPCDGVFERDQLAATGQLDRFVEAPFPARCCPQANSSAPTGVNFT
jgi:hypothetical protein